MLAISSRTCLKFCRGVQTFGLQFAAAFGFLSELELVPATFAVHVKNNQSLYFLMHFNIVAVGRMCLDGAAQCGFFLAWYHLQVRQEPSPAGTTKKIHFVAFSSWLR